MCTYKRFIYGLEKRLEKVNKKMLTCLILKDAGTKKMAYKKICYAFAVSNSK